MPTARSAPQVRSEQEKRELQEVIASGILGKAPNLQHFLNYVAEKYFAGEADQVKEYSIAVHALRRPESFDPQTDTIVRVTAHTLRKRLEQFYTGAGSSRPVQMQLPVGRYVLRFAHRQDVVDEAEDPTLSPAPGPELDSAAPATLVSAPLDPAQTDPPGEAPRQTTARLFPPPDPPPRLLSRPSRWPLWAFLGLAAAIFLSAAVVYLVGHLSGEPSDAGRQAPAEEKIAGSVAVPPPVMPGPAAGAAAATLPDLPSPSLHLLFGDHPARLVDTAGRTWTAAAGCSGGTTFEHADRLIQGTDDPALYLSGRSGRFECRIAEPPGHYQLELFFADTAGDKEATGQVVFTINHGPVQALDVVDEAGGDDAAVARIYPGVQPEADGFVHLDFLSDAAFVNAAELTPAPSAAMIPLRMLAGPSTLRDSKGNLWGPEEFFFGGRRTFHPENLPRVEDAKLFQWERFGHFHYSLPVQPGREYSARFYFSEEWFGTVNGGPGGPGSRTFDLYCNGTTLLKNFDILAKGRGAPVVIQSHHLVPTAQGKLELYFTPVKNYPLINAIEVEPEK